MNNNQGLQKSRLSQVAIGTQDGEVNVVLSFGERSIRFGLSIEQSAQLRSGLERAENTLKGGGSAAGPPST